MAPLVQRHTLAASQASPSTTNTQSSSTAQRWSYARASRRCWAQDAAVPRPRTRSAAASRAIMVRAWRTSVDRASVIRRHALDRQYVRQRRQRICVRARAPIRAAQHTADRCDDRARLARPADLPSQTLLCHKSAPHAVHADRCAFGSSHRGRKVLALCSRCCAHRPSNTVSIWCRSIPAGAGRFH